MPLGCGCMQWTATPGVGGDASVLAGGNGGLSVQSGQNGAGATAYGATGQDGQSIGAYGESGGGGGGFRGAHGCLLYMKVANGAVLSGGGVIDLSGQNGGNGGAGSACSNNNSPCNCATPCHRIESGGGPGGGAAGGSGGSFELRYNGPSNIQLLQSVTTGNGIHLAGGAGGNGGITTCGLATNPTGGTSGSIGQKHIVQF
jgi:hypothetical protein